MQRNLAPWRAGRRISPILMPVILVVIFIAAVATSDTVNADETQSTQATETADTVAALRAELAALRSDYEGRIETLERRLAELESASSTTKTTTAPSPAGPAEELAALRAAANAAAGVDAGAGGQATTTPVQPAGGEATTGRGGSLAALNPEISVTGVLLARASDRHREEFEAQEFELDLQSALDPFSRMRLTLALHSEEVEVEEGWVEYPALPGGIDLLAGRFRQRFGALNRQHLHALPQNDYPLPLQLFLGEEGLAQTGLSLSWLVPRPWADANEVTLEITDGDGEAFAGEDFQQLSVLAHLKNYWDLSDATYLEFGLSGVTGEGPEGASRRVYGADLTVHWQPPARAKYREVTWRTEALLSQRESFVGGPDEVDAWGAYTYVEALARQNLYVGIRLDGAENPDDPDRRVWGVTPYLTWWQSEYVRIRAELRHLEDDALGQDENQLVFQFSWAAGPHKHESY